MTRFEIVVEPYGSLFVGGYAQAFGGSDGDTASDGLGMLLPGSAVKGALREAAARLVHGAGRGEDLLIDLFGTDSRPGLIRIGTLRPEGPATVVSGDGTVRNHVSLDRATRQAAPQHLFQNRVTPALSGLRFRGVLESRAALSEDALGLLLSAVCITDQLGGGRGRGLGLVSVSLLELPAEDREPEREIGPEAGLVLVLEAREPLHLSSVKDLSNYVTSKDYLDGSTVRGAVAAALAGDEAAQEIVLGGEAPAVFGDGRPGSVCAIPAPMTLQVAKRGEGRPRDLAAALCAEVCGGRFLERPEDVRTAQGTWTGGPSGWKAFSVKRRTVTRTARDHASGRAADSQLYSLEIIDPALESADPCNGGSLRFYVPVSGSRRQLELVAKAARQGLTVGGDRSRGFGRLGWADVQMESPMLPLEQRHAEWAQLVGRLGVPHPEATGVLLAVGPLAVSHERLVKSLDTLGLDLQEGVARRRIHGGWNAAQHLPRSLSSHFLPGSTFLVTRRDGVSALAALATLETQGIGPGRADGWGRLIACHPIHVDCFEEEGSTCPR
jgi:CRISPR/Cas system CSM-associated protein Csm3 (group 7 of RAMP superfamily)